MDYKIMLIKKPMDIAKDDDKKPRKKKMKDIFIIKGKRKIKK